MCVCVARWSNALWVEGCQPTATAPVKKQLVFREGGGLRFLNFEAHLF